MPGGKSRIIRMSYEQSLLLMLFMLSMMSHDGKFIHKFVFELMTPWAAIAENKTLYIRCFFSSVLLNEYTEICHYFRHITQFAILLVVWCYFVLRLLAPYEIVEYLSQIMIIGYLYEIRSAPVNVTKHFEYKINERKMMRIWLRCVNYANELNLNSFPFFFVVS